MHKDVERVLVTKEELDQITTKLAEQITNDYKGSEKPLILITILKGSVLFASDLMKKIDLHLHLTPFQIPKLGKLNLTSGKNMLLASNMYADCHSCRYTCGYQPRLACPHACYSRSSNEPANFR